MSRSKLTAVVAAVVFAGAAFAQKTPQPGTHITVSKAGGGGMFSTVQAAVNAAQPGQVIEILDEGEYAEQVTIDGREVHPWGAGVVGGKSGITLRYVAAPGVRARPVIKHRDTTNRSPRNTAQAQTAGDGLNQSGNYETCGALRILRTSGVTVEGITVDGGGSAPFAWPGIWLPAGYPLAHGNAAITIVVSGNVQVRDCELRNAYFGLFVKDRNTGGVFGNPNPGDVDVTIPLSRFGQTGNHLFEYNRIGDNAVGLRFESSWDLGSTVRYNLIYRNYHKAAITLSVTDQDHAAGGIMFKDTYLSPIAIYNNTFFENTNNILGVWQVGAQHLVFNNIFGRKRVTAGINLSLLGNDTYSYTNMDGNFPHRMKHNVFAADLRVNLTTTGACPPYDISVIGISFSRFSSLSPGGGATSVPLCSNGEPNASGITIPYETVKPGADLKLLGTVSFPADANNRWLETAGGTFSYESMSKTFPNLFKSLDTASLEFLEPDWEAAEVKEFIRNAGWPASGILSADGAAAADLGAVQYGGKRPLDGRAQSSRMRVAPFSVVTVSGTTATAKFTVTDEAASGLTGLSIKYIRWIAPIPDNTDAGSGSITVIPAGSIRAVTAVAGTSITAGSNTVQFTLPQALAATHQYGFFELVLEGVDGIGRKVVSDVGFLPYRQLNNYLRINVVDAAGAVVPNPVVTVGEPVNIEVTAMNGDTPYTASGSGQLEVEYRLLSNPAAMMWRAITPELSNPLTGDDDLKTGTAFTKRYTVYFTKAGSEVVMAAGVWGGGTAALPFLGDLALTVRSGTPENIAFVSPIPKSMLGAAPPPVITGYYPVEVVVTDRFGNPSGQPVPVSVVSGDPGIAVVTPAAAATNPATGIASFNAEVAGGAPGDEFDLIASATVNLNGPPFTDTASLRVGRPEIPDTGDGAGAPGVSGGGYVFIESVINSVGLIFDRDVSLDWFSGMLFEFGPVGNAVSGPMTNLGCVQTAPDNTKAVTILFSCAFPGTALPEVLAAESRIVISYNPQYGWAPHTVSIAQGVISVLTPDRVIPPAVPDANAAVIPPAAIIAGEFTAGPNPAGRQQGQICFFRRGYGIESAKLAVYDASGNLVKRLTIKDKNIGDFSRRQVGAWDMKDRRGKPAAEGTYLVRGEIRTRDGKRERVSLIVGVR